MHEKRVLAVSAAAAIGVALALGIHASPAHALAIATGSAALTLLIASLACSPIAMLTPPIWSVAFRSARRRLGIASALLALGHACIALPGYLVPLTLAPIASVAWLRHGALALAILFALLVTSFPRIASTLRVRAWSALHRLVYPAALLAALHAIGVPFGSARAGVLGLAIVAFLIAVRLGLAWLPRRRTSD